MKLLVATNFSTGSQRAVRRAGLMAGALRASQLTLLHVVEGDRHHSHTSRDQREAYRVLTEQMSAMPELRGVRCHPIAAWGETPDVIVRVADATGADLIVMGANRKPSLRDMVFGTKTERVIGAGRYPVLSVNDEVSAPYERIMLAADISTPTKNAIKVARRLDLLGRGRVTVLHAFTAVGKGKMSLSGVDRRSIAEYVASERQQAQGELCAFLARNDVGGRADLRLEEGDAFPVIARAVSHAKPDLLVCGTHGRSGLAKFFLGSVTEETMRSLDVDILAVPSTAWRSINARLAMPTRADAIEQLIVPAQA